MSEEFHCLGVAASLRGDAQASAFLDSPCDLEEYPLMLAEGPLTSPFLLEGPYDDLEVP